MTKAKRPGKVFLDWSQNSGSKTTISPYSLRGRERPWVATPVGWDEVEAGAEDEDALRQFRFDEVLDRVDRVRRPVRRACAGRGRPGLPAPPDCRSALPHLVHVVGRRAHAERAGSLGYRRRV